MVGLKIVQGGAALTQNAALRPCSFISGLADCIGLGVDGGEPQPPTLVKARLPPQGTSGPVVCMDAVVGFHFQDAPACRRQGGLLASCLITRHLFLIWELLLLC